MVKEETIKQTREETQGYGLSPQIRSLIIIFLLAAAVSILLESFWPSEHPLIRPVFHTLLLFSSIILARRAFYQYHQKNLTRSILLFAASVVLCLLIIQGMFS